MVEQPPRRRDEVADALRELVGLGAAVGAADDEAVRLAVLRAQLAQDAVDLERELARRGDRDHPRPVARQPLRAREQLDRRHEERERLPAPRLRLRQHVLPAHQRRDRARLDLGERLEAHRRDRRLRAVEQVERRERHVQKLLGRRLRLLRRPRVRRRRRRLVLRRLRLPRLRRRRRRRRRLRASRFFFFSFRRSRRCAGERMGFDDAADDETPAAVEEPSTPLSFFLGFAASGATELLA